MALYRKKPVVIEAHLYETEKELRLAMEFIGKGCSWTKEGGLIIETLEGNHLADIGDYIIKGVKGEFYPCKPDIFKLTYDKEI